MDVRALLPAGAACSSYNARAKPGTYRRHSCPSIPLGHDPARRVCPHPVCYIYRYGSLREIKVSGGFNQKWYAYQKYRYTIPLSPKEQMSLKSALHWLRAPHAHTVCDLASHETPTVATRTVRPPAARRLGLRPHVREHLRSRSKHLLCCTHRRNTYSSDADRAAARGPSPWSAPTRAGASALAIANASLPTASTFLAARSASAPVVVVSPPDVDPGVFEKTTAQYRTTTTTPVIPPATFPAASADPPIRARHTYWYNHDDARAALLTDMGTEGYSLPLSVRHFRAFSGPRGGRKSLDELRARVVEEASLGLSRNFPSVPCNS